MTGRLLFIYIVATYMCLPIRAAGCTMVVDSLVINDSVSVSEVTVTARRAEFKWDKNVLVANVQDTDLKNELHLNDILQRLPGLWVKDGQVMLPGRKPPIYYINDRKVMNSLEIESLPVSNIKEIRVLTVPSPQYDSDGGPVIVITTKRLRDEVNLVNNASLLYNSHWSGMENLHVMLQKGKLNLYGLYRYNDQASATDSRNRQYNLLNDTVWQLYTPENSLQRTRQHTMQLGMDYQTESRTIGLKYYTAFNRSGKEVHAPYTVSNNMSGHTLELDNRQNSRTYSPYHHLSFFVSQKIGERWTVKNAADYLFKKNTSTTDVHETAQAVPSQTSYKSVGSWHIFSNQLSLIYQLNDNHSLSAGAYVKYSKGKNSLSYSDRSVEQYSETTETQYRTFASYSGTVGNWTLSAGINYDRLFTKSKDQQGRLLKEENIPHVRPYLSLSYLTSAGAMHMLDGTMTTQQPLYSDLNTSVSYINRFNYSQGNLYLRPSTEYSIGYTFYWKQLFVGLTYAFTKDPLNTDVTLYPGKPYAVIHQMINDRNYHTLILNANYRHQVGCWEPTVGFLCYKNFYTYTFNGKEYRTGRPLMSLDFSNIFHLPRDFRLTIDYKQNFKGEVYNIQSHANSSVNIELQRSFLKDRLQCSLKVQDIFNRQRSNNIGRYDKVMVDTRSYPHTRGISLNFVFRLNKPIKHSYKGESAAEDEIRRLNKEE